MTWAHIATTQREGVTSHIKRASVGGASASLYVGEVGVRVNEGEHTLVDGVGWVITTRTPSGHVDTRMKAEQCAMLAARALAAELLALARAIELELGA